MVEAVASEHRAATDWAAEREAEGDRELRPQRVLEAVTEWRGYERVEDLARALRTRTVMLWGGLAFLSFSITDALLLEPRLASIFIFSRLIGAAPLLLMWLYLRRERPPARSTLMLFEVIGTGSVAAVMAFMALLTGALGSPFLAAVVPVLAIRATGTPDPWRRGLALSSAPAIVFWAVLAGGSLGFPELVDPQTDVGTTLLVHLAVQTVTIAFVVTGSHFGWKLRRDLYKARRVGHYRLVRPLGRGAMGEVWAAWHQGLRQEVALKILTMGRSEGRTDPSAVERFEREVMATTALRHPNTVRVYDFGLTPEGLWYYAMELLEGETVAELVTREGPLPIGRALSLVHQAARALREAHERGVVHRDIKPENLFVSAPAGERDFVRVLDFGVATLAAETVALDLGPTEPLSLAGSASDSMSTEAPTDPGFGDPGFGDPGFGDPGFGDPGFGDPGFGEARERAVGTPLYISPEAARGRPTDARSDIYGLGGVLYLMLTARPPFIERTTAKLLRAHVEQRPTPPSALLSGSLPDYIEKLVMRCLEKDPGDRYPDADALIRAIELCMRLGDNDRRRGEAQQPRLRMNPSDLEALIEQSRTDTDMTLIKE
jgi:eukaryotic-like serine/threonine-protein kinase